jgi:hypothetical protein
MILGMPKPGGRIRIRPTLINTSKRAAPPAERCFAKTVEGQTVMLDPQLSCQAVLADGVSAAYYLTSTSALPQKKEQSRQSSRGVTSNQLGVNASDFQIGSEQA